MNTEIEKILSDKDPVIARVIQQTELVLSGHKGEVFEDLVSCILDMQIRCRGKAVRYNRLKEQVAGAALTPDVILNLPQVALDYINMSRQKLAALYDLASKWKEGQWQNLQWQEMGDEEIRQLLSSVKGVGNWTIDMILLFTLQRADVFPVDDMHLKKAMVSLYEIEANEKKEMLDIAEDWRPYRSFGVLYLLEYSKQIRPKNR